MASVNPKNLNWTNPTTYTDGTPYGQADNAGYTLQLDTTPAVSIPIGWGTGFDLTTLASYKALTSGPHTVAIAVVSKAGIASDFSTPATFQVSGKPSTPTNLVLSP